jgi:Right handed beta helix region
LSFLIAAAALVCSGCATGLTGSPTSIAPDSALVLGKVVSDTGGEVEFWVEFGRTTAYGSETAHDTVTAAPNTLVTVGAQIDGLQRATLYHYRFCARDSQQRGGPGCGEDRRFTTQSAGCGETVTSDIRLTGNLECPQEPGFVIGADGVDINLAGHSMLGGIGVGGGGPRGIDNSGGFDGLTVRNGDVTGFGFGIFISGGTANRVLDVAAAAAGNAITIEGGSLNEIRNSDLFGRSWGVLVTDSDDLLVAGTSASGAFGDGISVRGDFARILRNRVVRQGAPFPPVSGIALTGSDARVADNHVEGSWSSGGIAVSGARNVLVENVVVGATLPAVGEPASAGDGIFVGAFSSGATLRRNRADDNQGDGLEVQAPGTRLGDNSAFDNGDYGIQAVPGVIDLGGNGAGGNGNPAQCLNLFCQ